METATTWENPIKDLIKKHGINQNQLAEKMGRKRQWVHSICVQKTELNMKLALDVGAATGYLLKPEVLAPEGFKALEVYLEETRKGANNGE